jgi:hypothetical protein
MKTAILFTGEIDRKIDSNTFDILIEQTKHIENKFAAVWENENPEYIIKLTNNNFKIIYNDVNQQKFYKPQTVIVYNGLKYIKDSGYEYVLKTRYDILSYDYTKYLEMVVNKYTEKITVISGIQTNNIYFLETIVSGKINDMCNFYTLKLNNDGRYIEKALMEDYTNKKNLSRDEIRNIFNFSLTDCIINNFEFIWYRPQCWKSNSRTIPEMRIINEYCKESHTWI